MNKDFFLDKINECVLRLYNTLITQVQHGWGEHWARFQINRYLDDYIELIKNKYIGYGIVDQDGNKTHSIEEYANNIFYNIIMKNEDFIELQNTDLFLYNIILNIIRMRENESTNTEIDLVINIIIFKQALDFRDN